MVSGIKVKKSSIYNKNETFKISRSKFSSFLLRCNLCFYLEQKKGLKPIPQIPFTLNNAVDFNLKQTFDSYRTKKLPHKIMIDNDLSHVIPFAHPELDNWRDSIHKGIQYHHSETNLLLTGGIDDVWIDTKTEELIVIDYKAQAKNTLEELEPDRYWSNSYHEDFKQQLSFYRYLFLKNKFEVKQTAYIVHCNAKKGIPFEDVLEFHTSLIPYETNIDHIEPIILEIKKCLDRDEYPAPKPDCHYCLNFMARTKILTGQEFKMEKKNLSKKG